ncbi:MAG: acyltransferase [Kiritimatiellales bacterium]
MKLLLKIYNYFVFTAALIRGRGWSFFLGSCGHCFYLLPNCKLMSPANIHVGTHVTINHHTTLGGHGGLTLGNYVLIGPNCNILTANHSFINFNIPISRQGITTDPVKIEDDVWLGANVVVLPGVTIGRGSIVGANAVVSRDVPPFSIAGGVPARVIKQRFTGNDLIEAQKVKFN